MLRALPVGRFLAGASSWRPFPRLLFFLLFGGHASLLVVLFFPVVVVTNLRIRRDPFGRLERVGACTWVHVPLAVRLGGRMVVQRAVAEHERRGSTKKSKPITLDGRIAQTKPEFFRKIDNGRHLENRPSRDRAATVNTPAATAGLFQVKGVAWFDLTQKNSRLRRKQVGNTKIHPSALP